jgi:hypothetical protein
MNRATFVASTEFRPEQNDANQSTAFEIRCGGFLIADDAWLHPANVDGNCGVIRTGTKSFIGLIGSKTP